MPPPKPTTREAPSLVQCPPPAADTSGPLRLLLPHGAGGGAGGEVDVGEGALVVHVGGGEGVGSLTGPPTGLPLRRDEVVGKPRGVLGGGGESGRGSAARKGEEG